MGNKASRRRADTAAGGAASSSKADGTTPAVRPAAPQPQPASVDASGDQKDQKGVSCPDLAAAGGAVPYSESGGGTSSAAAGPRHVSYTIYRSHSNVAEAARRPEPRPDIRSVSR